MDRLPAGEPLTFLGVRIPPGFERRVIVVPSGGKRVYDDADWQDAIAVVERGEIELGGWWGTSHRFRSGDVLCLTGLRLRILRNPGSTAAVLVAISRVTRDGHDGRDGVKRSRAGDTH